MLDGETLALVTEDGDAVGFTGEDVEVEAPTVLVAALSGREPQGPAMPLTGTLTRDGRTITWAWDVALGEPA